MRMIEKPSAKLIADEIITECQANEPLESRLTFIAMARAAGEFLAYVEGSLPDARHLYFTALRTNLRSAREMRRRE